MTKPIVAALTSALLLVVGCAPQDGLSGSEQKAADQIARHRSGYAAGGALRRAAECYGRESVQRAGLVRLKKDGVLDDKLNYTGDGMTMMMLSPGTAEAMARASVKCDDPERLRPVLLGNSDSARAVDDYIACVHEIDEQARVAVMVHQYTHNQQTPQVVDAIAQLSLCNQPLMKHVRTRRNGDAQSPGGTDPSGTPRKASPPSEMPGMHH